jgi:hypothetical protein
MEALSSNFSLTKKKKSIKYFMRMRVMKDIKSTLMKSVTFEMRNISEKNK